MTDKIFQDKNYKKMMDKLDSTISSSLYLEKTYGNEINSLNNEINTIINEFSKDRKGFDTDDLLSNKYNDLIKKCEDFLKKIKSLKNNDFKINEYINLSLIYNIEKLVSSKAVYLSIKSDKIKYMIDRGYNFENRINPANILVFCNNIISEYNLFWNELKRFKEGGLISIKKDQSKKAILDLKDKIDKLKIDKERFGDYYKNKRESDDASHYLDRDSA